jgi:hypothetical protein
MLRLMLLAGIVLALGSAALGAEKDPGDGEKKLNPALVKLEADKWLKLHEQKRGEGVNFMRQAHGGSCYDSKRGLLVLFGSNTHSKDWKNNLFLFDPVKLAWSLSYPQDPKETYAVNEKGLPVAGKEGDHPWATHTFGAVMYDAKRDEIVVACYPSHMRPNKWGRAVRHLWGKIKKHPTWVYRAGQKKWHPLECKPMHFFPNSAAYDPDRAVIIGHRPGSIYELAGEPRQWKRTASGKEIPGWGHDNCAYDAKHKKLVVFGGNRNSNEIAVYDPAAKTLKLMPAKGARPPADQHNPMEFVPELGETVVLVDRTPKKDKAEKSTTETWCYDLGKDSWRQIKSATLPFACGMNFNLEYDSRHKVLLLVTGGYGGKRTTVWALRPAPAKAK